MHHLAAAKERGAYRVNLSDMFAAGRHVGIKVQGGNWKGAQISLTKPNLHTRRQNLVDECGRVHEPCLSEV
jgi:hypothetical protein